MLSYPPFFIAIAGMFVSAIMKQYDGDSIIQNILQVPSSIIL